MGPPPCLHTLRDDNQKSQGVSRNCIYLTFPEKEGEALNINKLLGEICQVLLQARLTLGSLARTHQLPFH